MILIKNNNSIYDKSIMIINYKYFIIILYNHSYYNDIKLLNNI